MSGELVVALDGDDVTPEVKAEIELFERQEMERLLYVALTRARHTLVLAFDEQIFARANGEVPPEVAIAMAPRQRQRSKCRPSRESSQELSTCIATKTRQEFEEQTSAREHKIAPFARLQPNEKREGMARGAHFVQKRNPSELATHFRILSGASVDLWNEVDPELRPLVQETPATRYGLWWHDFAQRLPWQSAESLSAQFSRSGAFGPRVETATGAAHRGD